MGIFFVLKQKSLSLRQAIKHKKFKKIYFFLEISGKKWGNVVNYKGKVVRSSVYWSIQ